MHKEGRRDQRKPWSDEGSSMNHWRRSNNRRGVITGRGREDKGARPAFPPRENKWEKNKRWETITNNTCGRVFITGGLLKQRTSIGAARGNPTGVSSSPARLWNPPLKNDWGWQEFLTWLSLMICHRPRGRKQARPKLKSARAWLCRMPRFPGPRSLTDWIPASLGRRILHGVTYSHVRRTRVRLVGWLTDLSGPDEDLVRGWRQGGCRLSPTNHHNNNIHKM